MRAVTTEPPRSDRALLRHVALLGLAVTSLIGFFEVGRTHLDFQLHNGPPARYEIAPAELGFYAWYLAFGVVFTVASSASLALTPAARWLDRVSRAVLTSRWLVVVAGAAFLAQTFAVKEWLLLGEPVTDDEPVYVFIARTLLGGHVLNPPPGDEPFFRATFVVLDAHGWYGKYPIGHPLFLAAGEAFGLRALVCPLLGLGTVLVTWRVARALAGPATAGLVALLLALSPQLVATSATDLSQNSGQLVMMLGVLALVRARDGRAGAPTPKSPAWGWVVAAGWLGGLGALIRPLPGALFVVAFTAWIAVGWRDVPARKRLWALALGGIGVATIAALMLWVQHVQTGDALTTGYHAYHGDRVLQPARQEWVFAKSLGYGLLRQWFWVSGWALGLAFVPFAFRARLPGRGLGLVWMLVAAGLSYRLLSPKVYVGTTGPVYLAEMVAPLALLTAVGMVRLRQTLRALPPRGARGPSADRGRWVAALAVGAQIAALTMFVPVEAVALARAGRARRYVPEALASVGASRSLVFANRLVAHWTGETWAMAPPPPSPSLDDDILYLRRVGTVEQQRELWLRRFPDRTPWVFELAQGEPVLVPLGSPLAAPEVGASTLPLDVPGEGTQSDP